jgi:Leucine-rich repeat (LRR) protein
MSSVRSDGPTGSSGGRNSSGGDDQTADWIKVWKLVQKPWTADVRPPSALSAASEANSGIGVGAARTGTRRLTDAIVTQRLALSSEGGGAGASGVFEIVLDNMQLGDLGDANGGVSPVAMYPNLRLLSANFNGIKSVAVGCVTAGLAELREIQLEYNELTALPLFDNPKLETLSVSNNKIGAISALVLPRLATLEASHNSIAHLEAKARLPALTHLDLSYNSIVTLDTFAELVHLTYLNVSHNQLTTLNGIQGMTCLEELVASHNRLRHVPTLQHSNPLRPVGKALATLDLSFNEISSLGFFPTGALTKVRELNLARNSFHGKKAPETPTGTLTPSSRGRSDGGIFGSNDIGDAGYDDDGPASKTPKGARPGGKRAAQQRPPGTASSTASASTRRSSSTNVNGRRQSTSEVADGVTFLARLVTIFPELETLDVSHNSDDLIPDYSDLRVLSKCPNLTELKIEGTLSLPRSNRNRKADAVAAFLPQIEVLDNEVLVKAPAPVVEDLQCDIPALAGSSNRPGTASSRPTSAIIRPGTSSKAKANAMQASKIDRDDVVESVTGFIRDAEVAREKCYAFLDHIAKNAAWVYGDSDEPPTAEELLQQRMSSLSRATSRPDVLTTQDTKDDDDDDESDVDSRAMVVKASLGSSAVIMNPSAPRKKPTSADGDTTGIQKGASPHSKMRSYSAATAVTSSSGQGNHSISGTQFSAAVSRTASTSAINRGVGSTPAAATSGPTNAMLRVRSEPSSNFNLEQARFKQEMDREASERRQQLLLLTKGAPPPMPVKTLSTSSLAATGASTPVGKPSRSKCESGTSTTSPSHNKKSDAAGSRPSSSVGAVRVSASTATSPAKDSPAPSLNAKRAELATSPAPPAAAQVPLQVPLLALASIPPEPDAAADDEGLDTGHVADIRNLEAPDGERSEVIASDPRWRSCPPPQQQLDAFVAVASSSSRRLGSAQGGDCAAPRPSSAQKVRMKRPDSSTAGGLLKIKPAEVEVNSTSSINPSTSNEGSDPLRISAPAEAGLGSLLNVMEEGTMPSVPTYYSTAPKPVQLDSQKAQPAGASLNNRRRK